MNSFEQVLRAVFLLAGLVGGASAGAIAAEPATPATTSTPRTCTHTIDCRPTGAQFHIDFKPVRFTLNNSGIRLPATLKPIKLDHRRVELRPRFEAPKPARFTLHNSGIVITRERPKVQFSIDETPLPLPPVEPPVVVFHIDDQIKAPPELKMPVITFKDPVFPPMPPDPPSLVLVCREQ